MRIALEIYFGGYIFWVGYGMAMEEKNPYTFLKLLAWPLFVAYTMYKRKTGKRKVQQTKQTLTALATVTSK